MILADAMSELTPSTTATTIHTRKNVARETVPGIRRLATPCGTPAITVAAMMRSRPGATSTDSVHLATVELADEIRSERL